jgi:hypothetical protein
MGTDRSVIRYLRTLPGQVRCAVRCLVDAIAVLGGMPDRFGHHRTGRTARGADINPVPATPGAHCSTSLSISLAGVAAIDPDIAALLSSETDFEDAWHRFGTDQRRADRAAKLGEALGQQRAISLATGIIMQLHRCSSAEAWEALRQGSSSRSIHDAAADVIRTGQAPR